MSSNEEPATSQFGATVVAPNSLPSRVGTAKPSPDPLAAGPAAWIGREIDDYRILRVLGAGGMGVVFLAQQRHPKRLVAIKTLHAGLHQAELLARFQQEAEILGRLKHPGIAQIHASGRTDASLGGVPYIVMEFVEGVPLLEHSDLRSEDVGAAAREGDAYAIESIRESGQAIGDVLAGLVNFFNPGMVVIGGGVANLGNLFLSSIRQAVLNRSLPLATKDLHIVFSDIGPDAGVIGAINLAMDYMFTQISSNGDKE